MLKLLKNNEQGIVFVTVLIIISIAMVLAISALSLNVSQVKSSEDEARTIQAQAITEGGFARIYVDQSSVTPTDSVSFNESLDATTFTVNASVNRGAAGPTGTASYLATVDVTF